MKYVNKDIFIIKPDKGNGVVILDRKLYDNAIQEIISDTSEFEKLSEGPTLKRKTSLERILCKLKQKNFARIYGTPKMHKFFSSVFYDATSLFTNIPLQSHFQS